MVRYVGAVLKNSKKKASKNFLERGSSCFKIHMQKEILIRKRTWKMHKKFCFKRKRHFFYFFEKGVPFLAMVIISIRSSKTPCIEIMYPHALPSKRIFVFLHSVNILFLTQRFDSRMSGLSTLNERQSEKNQRPYLLHPLSNYALFV